MHGLGFHPLGSDPGWMVFLGFDNDQVIGNLVSCLTLVFSSVLGIEFMGFASVEVYPLCIC